MPKRVLLPDASNMNEPSREEIVANVLHVLSSSTTRSPFLCNCQWEKTTDSEGNDNGIANIRWDPFPSFARPVPDVESDSGAGIGSKFLHGWLDDNRSRDPSRHRHEANTGVGGEGSDDDAMQIAGAFADTGRIDELLNGDDRPDSDSLWRVGLDLLETHLFPGDDDPIPPHELLRTVMDSYYCADRDLELDGLSSVGMGTPSEKVFGLPSSISMLFLRSLLISRALESAEESIRDSSESPSRPVRWRRLKSMVDDALSLFGTMLFDYAGKSIDSFEYGRDPKTTELYPVEPEHVIAIATWLYANHIFPSCHGLLRVLLQNEEDNSKGGSSGVKILKTCYDSFTMLTSLLALEASAVNKEYASPSRCTRCLLDRIESKTTTDFFHRAKLAQEAIAGNDDVHASISDDEEELYCPWKDSGPGLGARGLSLEEDLLLYPSIRKTFENSAIIGSATFYDELGIAMIAYWKLRAQTDSSIALDALPHPYCGSYRWTLLFPHVVTLLSASKASSTIKRMDELELLSMFDDEHLFGIGLTTFSLGCDMLHMLITKTPGIRPTKWCTNTQNSAARWTNSSLTLESTIVVLLSHVVALSSLESSRGKKSPPVSYAPLNYSSMEVMNMTRALLGFYDPSIQIRTLSGVCKLIRRPSERVLLSTVLDFMRPIIMGMCKNIQQCNDDAIVLDNMGVMESTREILDIFLSDMYDTFDDPLCPLPKDVDEFMTYIEAYSSVFAAMRLQRIWISRCDVAVKEEMLRNQEALNCFDRFVKWMDTCLGKLQCFDSSLSRLIDFWENSADRPVNWHRLFLMKLALQDALTDPTI